MSIVQELEKFPLTGRFLLGRLRDALSQEDRQRVENLIDRTESFDSPTTILERGNKVDHSTMLIEGFVLRTVRSGDKRYVVGIQVSGDFVDLHAFALKRLDHDLVTIGNARVGYCPHDRIKEIMERWPHLARLLWFSTLLDAAIHREWIMKLEQLRAPRRVAHIFCEILYRLEMVGLGSDSVLETPLIQADLADMCGTTAIHMNRAVRHLREAGLADFNRGRVTIPDRQALCEYARFDPAYLYGEGDLSVQGELTEDGLRD